MKMRFNCGKSVQKKLKDQREWHSWFAWYPVRVAENDCYWLEYVERKEVPIIGRVTGHILINWKYRKLE